MGKGTFIKEYFLIEMKVKNIRMFDQDLATGFLLSSLMKNCPNMKNLHFSYQDYDYSSWIERQEYPFPTINDFEDFMKMFELFMANGHPVP